MTPSAWPCIALVVLAACSSCREAPAGGGADASPSASAAPSSVAAAPSSAPSVEEAPQKPRVPCRPLALKGEIQVVPGDAPFGAKSAIDGSTWLRLGKDASLSTRHSTSARELSARGPALVEPCVDGAEDWVIADGTVETSAGPGARPGAEVNVFTPLGSVSYGDAHLEIHVKPGRVEILALGGEAWIVAATGVTRSGPDHIAAPKGKLTLSGKVTAGGLVTACEKAADAAEAAARSVLGRPPADAGGDAGSLGERAAAHLQARRAARAACGSARGAVEADKDEAARPDLRARLTAAERRWQTISPPPPPH